MFQKYFQNHFYKNRKNKKIGKTRKIVSKNNGFIALFFVISVASFLALLICNISMDASYVVGMFNIYREKDGARSSAIYCKIKLFNNLQANFEYIPDIHREIYTPFGSTCIYYEYKNISPLVYQVTIVGRDGRNSKQVYTMLYTYSVTDTLFNFIHEIETRQID